MRNVSLQKQQHQQQQLLCQLKVEKQNFSLHREEGEDCKQKVTLTMIKYEDAPEVVKCSEREITPIGGLEDNQLSGNNRTCVHNLLIKGD